MRPQGQLPFCHTWSLLLVNLAGKVASEQQSLPAGFSRYLMVLHVLDRAFRVQYTSAFESNRR